MSTSERRKPRVNWFAVAVAVVIGIVYLVVGVAKVSVLAGVGGFAVMIAVAGALAFLSRRSDTIALLGDDTHDERHVHIHQRAALYTLNILAAVLVGAFVVDVARGGDGSPYIWLAALGGVTYIVFVLVLNRRH